MYLHRAMNTHSYSFSVFNLYRANKFLLPVFFLLLLPLYSAAPRKNNKPEKEVSLLVLGTLQDGGLPHAGCKKDCCKKEFTHPNPNRKVVSLGIIDSWNEQTFLFEATPDMATQIKQLQETAGFGKQESPNGICITHAHIGHYAGLMYLGKEAMNTKEVPVFALPRMKKFLESNGPWEQLVSMKNIELKALKADQAFALNNKVQVTPLLVPHRDEYSETVAYILTGPNKKALFLPDIDKWEKWDQDIVKILAGVDYAFLDATFYNNKELNNRDMKQVPHPFVEESLEKFEHLSATDKGKIYFIHFNHTNPLLNLKSKEAKEVIKKGYHLAQPGLRLSL